MPIGRALSAECNPALGWKNPEQMHRACRHTGGRFLHHKTGEGAGRQNFRARCTCPCHALTRASIPELNLTPEAQAIAYAMTEREPGE